MMLIVNCLLAVCAVVLESLTCTLNVKLPTWLGLPLKAPLEEFNPNPAGREPEVTDHVYGAVPPAAASVAEYATPD